MKALLDFIPLILFLVLYHKQGIWTATQALLVSTVIIYFFHFISQKFKLEKMQWFVLLATVAFGSITLLLHDDFWIRLKGPAIWLITALVFLFSPLFTHNKEPLVKKIFEQAFELSPKGWMRLNSAWVAFYLFLAALNAYFALYLKVAYWVDLKVYVGIGLNIVFIAGQFYVLRKYIKHPEA